MPYTNPCTVDRVNSGYAWYPLESMKENLHTIEQLDFTLISDRRKIQAIVNHMMKGLNYNPFNTINRFPRQACLVYMEAPDMIKTLYEMKKALSHLPVLSQDEEEENHCHFYQAIKMIANMSINNRTQNYYDSLVSLKMAVVEGKHTYSRSKFEEKFNVQWKND